MTKNPPDALEEQCAAGYAGRSHSRRLQEAATKRQERKLLQSRLRGHNPAAPS